MNPLPESFLEGLELPDLFSRLGIVVFCRRLGEEWESFKDTYGKKYVLPTEEIRRRFIWLRNRQRINAHNEQADLGLHSYRMAINAFADMVNLELFLYLQAAVGTLDYGWHTIQDFSLFLT